MATRSKATRSKAARPHAAPSTQHRIRPRPAAADDSLDAIPYWPQLKLDIVRRYGAAYSTIASRQPGLAHYWIDGFVRSGADGAGRDFVPGSALNALLVTPPFHHHHLVNLDGQRAGALRRAVDGRADVTLHEGTGSRALIDDILPRVRQEDYRRALCVLDPCAPGPDWRAIEMAGRLKTIDLFAVFPDSPESPPDALKRRLHEDAGFANVLHPLALRDGVGRIAAHLFFASRSNMANGIVEDIFTTWRDGPARAGGAR